MVGTDRLGIVTEFHFSYYAYDPLWSLVSHMLFFLRILHKELQNHVYENWKLEIKNKETQIALLLLELTNPFTDMVLEYFLTGAVSRGWFHHPSLS